MSDLPCAWCWYNPETGQIEECETCRDIREPLPHHIKRCGLCRKTVNELTDSHVKDGGYPVPNWWHTPCWNEVQEEIAASQSARLAPERKG